MSTVDPNIKVHHAELIDVDGQDLLPGRMVFYQTDGRNGLSYTLPAIVNCTRSSYPGDYPSGQPNPLERPGSVADQIDSDSTVHLTVLTPGGVGAIAVMPDDGRGVIGHSRESESFPHAMRLDVRQASGTYVEHHVPYDADGRPGTWRWMR